MGCSSSTSVGVVVSKKKRFHENYKLGRKLGEGAFGQVRLAKFRETNEDLAVKIVDVRSRDYNGEPAKEADAERLRATRNEVTVWQAIGVSENIVLLQACFFENNIFYMVMEKCECSLMDKLSKASTMVEHDLVRIFCEMLRGIAHVHGMQVAHRDIKPDNFLFGGTDGSTVKLCDFGLAAKLQKNKKLKGVYGTAPYMSPEMLSGGGYDELTDVWSFGATAYLMIHGDFPYSPREATAPAMKRMIVAGEPEIQFDRPASEDQFFSRSFVDRAAPFLQALLQRSPQTRRHAQDVLRLPFLSLGLGGSTDCLCVDAEEAPLAPAFRKARKATRDVKDLITSPVKQRNLDELLAKLQARDPTDSTMFFSEAAEEEDAPVERSEKSDRRIRRRSETRHCTHSGVLLEQLVNDSNKAHAAGETSPADTASTASPTGDDDTCRAFGSAQFLQSGVAQQDPDFEPAAPPSWLLSQGTHGARGAPGGAADAPEHARASI